MAVVQNKLSSLIEYQFPEVLRNDFPEFIGFIKGYYQFLESIQLCFTSVSSTFIEGETVTGGTSGAKGKLLSADASGTLGSKIYIYVHQENNVYFILGETITGETSGCYGTLSHYRRNPLNASRNIMDFDDVDSPNNDLFSKYRYEFTENFPESLPIDKSLLLKHVREIYLEKGDERSYETLFRAAFGTENLEFYYPKTDIVKPSDGKWKENITLQVPQNADYYNFITKTIQGNTSGATAFVIEASSKSAGALYVLELYLKNIEGVFQIGETITSQTAEANGTFLSTETYGVLSTASTATPFTITNAGNGYILHDEIPVVGGGGTGSDVKISGTSADQVVELIINQSGTKYQVDDVLDFDNSGVGATTSAQGKVSSLLESEPISVNTQRVFDMANTQVMTLTSETDIPVRLNFLLADTASYANGSKQGIVFQPISNTVIRYGLTKGSKFTDSDTVYAFREDATSFTPVLTSTVSYTSTDFSNDVQLNASNYGDNSANTNHVPIFTTKTVASTLTDSFDFQNETFGKINELVITDFGTNYTAIPSISVKTNNFYKTVNSYQADGGGVLGNDASLVPDDLGGGITSLIIKNPGAGFASTPTLDFTGFGDGTALVTILLDILRYYEGYYSGVDGQLSSQKKIQDSKYYQDFSYVLKTDTSINNYRDLILDILHPAGTILFGEVIVRDDIPMGMFGNGIRTINDLDLNNELKYRTLFKIIESNIDVSVPLLNYRGEFNPVSEIFFPVAIKIFTSEQTVGSAVVGITQISENRQVLEEPFGGTARCYSFIQAYDISSVTLNTTSIDLGINNHYLNVGDEVYFVCNGTLNEAAKFTRFKIDSKTSNSITLKTILGTATEDYTGFTYISNGRLYRPSKEIHVNSEISMLASEYIGYYQNEIVDDYNFISGLDLTQKYSSNESIIFDRRYLYPDADILLETGESLLHEDGSILNLDEVIDDFYSSDYQYHEINTVSSSKITLKQPIRYFLNVGALADNGRDGFYTLYNHEVLERV